VKYSPNPFPSNLNAYLFKPVDIDQIKAAIEVANYQRNLELTNERIIADLKNEIDQRKKAEKERNLRLQERNPGRTKNQPTDETEASDGDGPYKPRTCHLFNFYLPEKQDHRVDPKKTSTGSSGLRRISTKWISQKCLKRSTRMSSSTMTGIGSKLILRRFIRVSLTVSVKNSRS